jgi:hypothetical protein
LKHFGAWTNHGQTQIYKIHHSLDLREATTFPLIVYFVLSHGTSTKCHFILGLPSGRSKIPIVETPATLGAHNFACRPPIEMRSEAKLYLSLRTFKRYVTCHLHAMNVLFLYDFNIYFIEKKLKIKKIDVMETFNENF